MCIAALIGLYIWNSPNRGTKVTRGDGTQVRINVAPIESVLVQDSTTGSGASSVSEVVTRMHAIDTSGCPSDFQSAYLAHVHAWESMAQVEQQVKAFKAEREGWGDFVEGAVRGFLGDPLGKANEIQNAQNELQREYQAASQDVKQTFHRVQELAVHYGAKLPTK